MLHGWFIVSIEGSWVKKNQKKNCISFSKDRFCHNIAGPGELPHCVAFHMGLHCLPKYPFLVLGR